MTCSTLSHKAGSLKLRRALGFTRPCDVGAGSGEAAGIRHHQLDDVG